MTTSGVGGSFKTEGTYVHLLLIHMATRQKPTQYCKAVILQLKRNFKKEPSTRCLDQNHSQERRCRECFGAKNTCGLLSSWHGRSAGGSGQGSADSRVSAASEGPRPTAGSTRILKGCGPACSVKGDELIFSSH